MLISRKHVVSGIAVLAVVVMSPFAVPVIAGIFMSIAGMPYQKSIEKLGISQRLAAFLHALSWALLLALPAWLIIETALPALVGLLKAPPSAAQLLSTVHGMPFIGDYLAAVLAADLSTPLSYQRLASWASANAVDLKASLHHVWLLLAHIGIALLVAEAVARNHVALERALDRLLSWISGDEMFSRTLLQVFTHSIRSVMLGMLGVTLFNGILIGTCMALVKLPVWPVWAIAVALMSTVPLGALVVIVLASLILLSLHGWQSVMLFFIASNAVVLVADFLIKPKLTGARTEAPFMLVLLSILGGIEVFGLIGVMIGPVLVLSVLELWQMWAGE